MIRAPRRAVGLSLILLAGGLSLGCAPTRERILEEATAAGLTRSTLVGGSLRLASWSRPAPGPLTVYIEGDGHAWTRRDQPSRDPTPRQPVALALAARHGPGAVLYLARPCQFLRGPGCVPSLWTRDRFAPGVIAAMDRAISAYLGAHPARDLRLVGFSGGGVVAALIAARRPDVSRLTTLAAPLDLDAWTRWHGLSPFPAGDSPLAWAEALGPIPQRHLVGDRDTLVPPAVARAYMARARPPRGELRVVPGLGHEDWVADWPAWLGRAWPSYE